MLVSETLNREELWAVQTPQLFRFDIIAGAHEQIKDEVTDDGAMVERLGYKVRLYMGSYDNIKITTPEDLVLAELVAGKK
jgi:2-C-methyl-D-erythritol 4-phosphate cytidylyltransferase